MLAGGVLLAVAGGAAEHQAHGDAGDRRVDAAVVHQRPVDQGQRHVDVPAADALAQQQPEDGEAQHGEAERDEVELRGEEDRDDQDREEVVDDGEGEQERAQRGRQRRADDREDGEREGDVGGGRHRPAAERAVADLVDGEVDQCRRGHAADRGDHGQDRGLRLAQLTGHELAFELDTRDEEEDGEQPVGGPVLDGQVEAERGGAEVQAAEGLVALAQRGVRPDDRRHGGYEQQDAADRLGAQCLGDVVPLGQGQPSEEGGTAGLGRGHVGGLRWDSAAEGTAEAVADQTSRLTRVFFLALC